MTLRYQLRTVRSSSKHCAVPYDLHERQTLLDSFYDTPAASEVLRSPAVNSVVPFVSESAHIRPHINAAGSRYMQRVLDDPAKAGLQTRPGLIVIDGRNQQECTQKFKGAGVRPLGTFVLTCPEITIARRIMPGADESAQRQEAARLKRRNAEDRSRTLGRMTLPEDLSEQFVLHRYFRRGRPHSTDLLEAGYTMAADEHTGAVVSTRYLTLENEQRAVEYVLWGALKQAGERDQMAA